MSFRTHSLSPCASLLKVILWSKAALKPVWAMPTLGGQVFAAAVSPHDGATIAAGGGDSVLRLWQTRTARTLDCQSVWRGIQAKIRAVRALEWGLWCCL